MSPVPPVPNELSLGQAYLGSTSVARIERETSIARMIFRCSDGSVTTALGRAIATISTPNASRKTTGGTCRRTRARGPITYGRSRPAALQQNVQAGEQRQRKQEPQHLRRLERHRWLSRKDLHFRATRRRAQWASVLPARNATTVR